MTFLSKHIRDCIDACYKVVSACERCADVTETITCQELCRETADLAALAMRFFDRQSHLAAEIAALTVKACRAAAAECSRYESEEHVACAQACRAAAGVLTENAIVLSAFQRATSQPRAAVTH
jgi:hypothetical protein